MRRWSVLIGAALVVLGGGAVAALLALVGPKEPDRAFEPPGFDEQATAAGLGHVYDGEWTFFVGGGVAVFDCDADYRPDVYLAGGTEPAALFRNTGDVGEELRFEPVPGPGTDLTEVTGAYPLDIDGDGWTDLAVLRLGENVILRGRGDCRFERANELWGINGGNEWTAAFSARWEDDESLPTLAFGNYVTIEDENLRSGRCSDNILIRANGAGYGDPVPLTPGWCTLSILFSDWDRSGRRDLRVTNDKHYYRDGEEQLWRVEKEAAPVLYSREQGWNKMQIWGMGIASFDLTGDGFPEVFLTSQGDNKLQTLADGAGRPAYTDIAIRRGVTAHRPFTGDQVYPSTAWHPEFQDVNNDGFIDLFVSKGNVEAMPDYAAEDPNNLFLGQPDGTFEEGAATAGILNFRRTRGAALVDFNLDGLLDLIEVNRREPVTLWRNLGWEDGANGAPPGEWVAVRLEQPGANRAAIGAWIELEIGDHLVSRELTVGGGHAGGQLGWVHFGLGEADRARVRVQWPDGETGPWMKVESGRFWIIERDDPDPRRWDPVG